MLRRCASGSHQPTRPPRYTPCSTRERDITQLDARRQGAATSDAAIAGALRFALATLAAQPRSQRPEELVFELRVPAKRLVERLDTLELDITDPDDVLAVDPTLVRLGRDRIVFLRVADRGAASGPKIEWDRAWQQVGERLHRGDIFTVHWIAAIGDAPWAHDFTAFPWIGFTFRAPMRTPAVPALFARCRWARPFVWPTEDPVILPRPVFQRKVSARLRASSLATLAGDLVRYRREARRSGRVQHHRPINPRTEPSRRARSTSTEEHMMTEWSLFTAKARRIPEKFPDAPPGAVSAASHRRAAAAGIARQTRTGAGAHVSRRRKRPRTWSTRHCT